MHETISLWEEFQACERELQTERAAAFAPLRVDIERMVDARRADERAALHRQGVRLAKLRQILATDARPLVRTPSFEAWLAALLLPRERAWGSPPEDVVPRDASSWALLTQNEPVGLHAVEMLELPGYNDEEHFLATQLVVEASLGKTRFFIGFETKRRFALHENSSESLAEEIEYSSTDLDDAHGWPPRKKARPRPTWDQVMEFTDTHAALSKQVFALARFAVPMLEAKPAPPSFRYP